MRKSWLVNKAINGGSENENINGDDDNNEREKKENRKINTLTSIKYTDTIVFKKLNIFDAVQGAKMNTYYYLLLYVMHMKTLEKAAILCRIEYN